MRQIITFLGTVIKPTVYRLGEQEYTARVFAEALRQFVDFDRMLVCATERARETTWPLVTMYPLSCTTKPEPMPWTGCSRMVGRPKSKISSNRDP